MINYCSPRVLSGLALRICLFVCTLSAMMKKLEAADFQSADLPPVLEFTDGSPVVNHEDWKRRRAEIKQLWCDTYIGQFPHEVPSIQAIQIINQNQRGDGVIVRNVRLTFDTPNRAAFEIRLLLPQKNRESETQGLPLLLTQPRHYQIAWGEAAVERGYVACFYPGVDYNHREEAFPGYENVWRTFQKEYPNATWSSSLGIQSWLASRSLDYLLGDQSGLLINPERVGIIGHSRYGKQSLYAAAFDERFTAVVSRSAGSPAAAGYRFTGRDTFMETVLDAPSEWALPSLKRYFGREDALPVESNGLMALIAPRYCLLHTAHNDGSDPSFAVERSYLGAKVAYQFLNAPENIALQYRGGNHNPITKDHIRSNLDWFDWAFKRGDIKRSDFKEKLLHDFDWKQWKAKQSSSDLIPPGDIAPLNEKVDWLMGDIPEGLEGRNTHPLSIIGDDSRGVAVWSRERWKPDNVNRLPVSFGSNIQGQLAFPKENSRPLPIVIWLHPFNYSHGSNEGYGVEGTTIYYRLAQAGYAVLSFDQCGFGDRLLEGASFYDKYPQWSKLGKMVYDVRCALNFLTEGRGIAAQEMPPLDRDKIMLVGYSLGGMVALHGGAFDDRVTGIASFCGFTPFRTDSDEKPTGGIRRWWQWHGLLPKLGLFDRNEEKIPYDFDELLKSASTKPILIYSALHDRGVDSDEVEACVQRAGSGALTFIHAEDVNRFQSSQHKVLIDWLASIE